MRDDATLLEKAARAAGIKHEGEAGAWLAGQGNPALLLAGTETVWNPLRDDGDALRLAVKLTMSVEFNGDDCDACATNGDWVSEPHGTDPDAATRRAIVRAAASLGALDGEKQHG